MSNCYDCTQTNKKGEVHVLRLSKGLSVAGMTVGIIGLVLSVIGLIFSAISCARTTKKFRV